MKINLRKTKIKKGGQPWKGNYALFLDIFDNGIRKKEYLRLTIIGKPTTPQQRQANKEALIIADRLYTARKAELQGTSLPINTRVTTRKDDFTDYYADYVAAYSKADVRVIQACYNKFIDFIISRGISRIPGAELNKTFCEDFAEYLKTKLKYSSPRNYFKKFRSVLLRAYDDKVITFSPRLIKVRYSFDESETRKFILDDHEIILLNNTPPPHGSETICRAYTVSLFQGIDYSTVKKMTYSWVQGDMLDFVRPKTQRRNKMPLSRYARAAIGELGKPDELVFNNLPAFQTCVNHVRKWAESAGIKKKITWHSARHSFGTQVGRSTDIRTTADLLGQRDLRSTQKYMHTDDIRKRNAINSLPG